ncbi:hypothetical protein YC2023_078206 [Brassica napus]
MRKEENNHQTDNKSRVDPNLPKWVCQKCHHSLTIVGVDSYAGKFFNDSPFRFYLAHMTLSPIVKAHLPHPPLMILKLEEEPDKTLSTSLVQYKDPPFYKTRFSAGLFFFDQPQQVCGHNILPMAEVLLPEKKLSFLLRSFISLPSI